MAKSKYQDWITEEGLVQLQGWARDGLTDEQIAAKIPISRSTLNEWKKKYPDISDTLKAGKEVVDRKVENSLLQRALGTEIVEKQYKVVDRDADVIDVERRRFRNQYKLDHPEATKKEISDAAILAISTRERIQIYETHKQIAPDVGAATFWLKNRKPEEYRDQTFRRLNEAQTNKALADVRKANAEATIAEHKAKVEEDMSAGNISINITPFGDDNDEY